MDKIIRKINHKRALIFNIFGGKNMRPTFFNTTNMGVATPWPKGAMAPPIIWEKKIFKHFLVYFIY